jgi:hypothetical protein
MNNEEKKGGSGSSFFPKPPLVISLKLADPARLSG